MKKDNSNTNIPHDDKFWDLTSELSSKTKNTQNRRTEYKTADITSDRPYSTSPHYTDIPIPQRSQDSDKQADTKNKRLLTSYKPQNPLIKEVEIYTDINRDSVYNESGLFLRERAALIDRVGVETAYAPFFAISPRYSQMTRKQLNYYLWWRENMRHGICIKTDASYVSLYAHELISATDGDAEKTLEDLCSLLDVNEEQIYPLQYTICNIIVDYCLINNITLSEECLTRYTNALLNYSSLPELFVDLSKRDSPDVARFLIASASVYSYKKSKYYVSNKNLYDKHMTGAICAILSDDNAYKVLTSFVHSAYGEVTSSRRPYFNVQGLACQHARTKVTYYPLSLLKSAVTDALRYTENKLRDHLGIKSKLNIMTVNPDIKKAIDEYASVNCPPMTREHTQRINERREEEKYSKLYDTPRTPLSRERALEIENSSWDTTRILIEAFPDTHSSDNAVQPTGEPISTPEQEHKVQAQDINIQKPVPMTAPKQGSDIKTALTQYSDFLELCKKTDFSAQRSMALSLGIPLDELADEVNSVAIECIGDLLIEDSDGGYIIIDDYKNLV